MRIKPGYYYSQPQVYLIPRMGVGYFSRGGLLYVDPVLVERYIELCETLNQPHSRALKKMGNICALGEGEWDKGTSFRRTRFFPPADNIEYYSRALEQATDAFFLPQTYRVLCIPGPWSKQGTHFSPRIQHRRVLFPGPGGASNERIYFPPADNIEY